MSVEASESWGLLHRPKVYSDGGQDEHHSRRDALPAIFRHELEPFNAHFFRLSLRCVSATAQMLTSFPANRNFSAPVV